MAERKITTNTFGEGLIMDFAPDNTPNTSLSNALNATLLTYNGNEMSLQNDMGNGRVESAYLPEGYIPVGVCEFGDIIYIASYNPLINKSQIGCFPSPERNISNKEISDLNTTFSSDELAKDGTIVNSNIKKIIFGNKNIGPGDKFIISWGQAGLNNKNFISNFGNKTCSFAEGESYWPKLVKLHIVSIQDDGKLIYLDNDVQWYPTDIKDSNSDNAFPISTEEFLDKDGTMKDLHNLDEYRHALNCQYSVFQQKVSGKLGILLELESINNFNCGHKIFRRNSPTEGEVFDIYFSASWDTDNYNINPSGIIITKSTLKNMSLVSNEGSGENITHYKDYLQVPKKGERDRNRMIEFTRLYKLEEPGKTYEEFKNNSYYTKVKNYLSFKVPGSIEYTDIPTLSTDLTILDKVGNIRPSESITTKNNSKISTNVLENTETPVNPDINDTSEITKPIFKIYKYRPLIKNLLRAYVVKDDCKVPMTITKEYEETKEDKKIKKSITLGAYYCNPEEINDDGQYTTTINGIKIPLSPEGIPDDVVVNTFKRPVLVKVATVKKKELDKNTKDAEYHIDYTVCPCMPYGVLDHLAISNTIDFNKNQDGSVNLDTWKYYVNADSITLNYGLTTNLKEDENEVVEKVVMEFYDNQGLSASYEIKNQDTFDAKFTEYIELDKESSNYKILNTKIPENSISRDLTELIPHAGEYAGQCVKDIIDDDHEKYVYFDKNQKVRSATDLFDKDGNLKLTENNIENLENTEDPENIENTEDPEISNDNTTEEKYHYSYTLTKTTSECLRPIEYSLSYTEDINNLDAISYIKGNIFHGIGFTQQNKQVFEINKNSIKWCGEDIPNDTKYYFILGKHGESSYTSVEFKTFMGFSIQDLDFIIVYYYNLAGGINLYYTTVTQSGVETKCPIIKINPELTKDHKQIKFSVNVYNADKTNLIPVGNIKELTVKINNKEVKVGEDNKYIIDVEKGNTYNAIASVTTQVGTTEEWTTSIFFYFTVYTTTSNPVTPESKPFEITFTGETIKHNGNSFIQYEPSTDVSIDTTDMPDRYNQYNINSGTDAGMYFNFRNDYNYSKEGLYEEKLYLEASRNIYYKIITPGTSDKWHEIKAQAEAQIATIKNSGPIYLGIIAKTQDALEIETYVYKITIINPEKPTFTWDGTYNNGDVQLTITPDTDIINSSIKISQSYTIEKTNKNKSLIYIIKNPKIDKYTGTIYLDTSNYHIENSFNFEIKGNASGGTNQSNGIPIIKWEYPSRTFTSQHNIKFGVNSNNCDEYLTTLITEDSAGIHTENLGKEFNAEKSVTIKEDTKVTVSITDYKGNILNSDSRKYVISLSDVPVYPNNAGILYYGRPYYVLIKIFKARLDELGKFDRENYEFPIIYQRWLWTAPIFNDNYTTYNDFKDCQFQTGLDFIGYLNGKKLIDQISSKILLPKCLMDNYPKDSEFKVIDSIGANINIVGSQTDPNITFTGVPDVADSYGSSIFLSNESYDNISVSIGLGNKRVLIDDTKTQLQDSDEEYSLPQILPDSGNPDSSVLEDSDPILGKDNFNLELLFKGYTPIKTTESYRYYDSTGLNIRERTFDMYKIPLQNWLPTDDGNEAEGTPLLRLYGIKYNKMAARERILLDSYKRIKPIIEKEADLEQYGLSINGGIPYYDKIPYLGFSEKKGGGTQTHLTCGYLEYTNADDKNPRLYIKFYDKIDGNPFKGNFQNEQLSKFLDNISTSLVQQIIVGRGCRIGSEDGRWKCKDGVDGDAIRSPRPYRLTSRMGSGTRSDTIMGYRQNDRQYFPFPAYLTENPDIEYNLTSKDKYNCTVNSEKDVDNNDDIYSELCTFKGKAAFHSTTTRDNFYTYTLLGIQDSANGFIGTADGGILQFANYGNGDFNLPQNFVWSKNATNTHTNKVKNYAQIVASLLSQIYVLSDDEKDHYILQNLVKLNKYNEAWKADILVKLHCNTENKNSSKFINIIPKKFIQEGNTYVGINLFAFAAAAQYNALHPVDNEGNKISLESYANSKTFKFNDANNINPEFSDLVKCIEFSYDLPYDLGDLETQCYNSNFASQNFLQNIYTNENDIVQKQIPVSQTLNNDQLYVFNGSKFIPFNHGSNIYLIDKFIKSDNQGTLFGIISQDTNNLVKLELNRSSNIHEALTYDGARLVFKDITKLQGYDSKYTWILKTHGDNPELRDLANINLFNYGRLV